MSAGDSGSNLWTIRIVNLKRGHCIAMEDAVYDGWLPAVTYAVCGVLSSPDGERMAFHVPDEARAWGL